MFSNNNNIILFQPYWGYVTQALVIAKFDLRYFLLKRIGVKCLQLLG